MLSPTETRKSDRSGRVLAEKDSVEITEEIEMIDVELAPMMANGAEEHPQGVQLEADPDLDG